MLVAMNINLTDATQTQAFAQICALATQAGIVMQVGTGASAPVSGEASAVSPKAEPTAAPKRDYSAIAPATDHEVIVKRLDATHCAFAEYASGALAKARKAHIKTFGLAWDAEFATGEVYKRATGEHAVGDPKLGAWSGTEEQLNKLFGKRSKTAKFVVKADAIEEVRAKAQAKAERKAGRA